MGLYKLMVFAMIAARSILAAPENIYKEYASTCGELFKPMVVKLGCTKYAEAVKEIMGACSKSLDEPWMCDNSECLLKLAHIDKANDKSKTLELDEAKLEEMLQQIEKSNSNQTAFINSVRLVCLNKKYDEYMPEEPCSPLKYQICLNAFAVTTIPRAEWKASEECSTIYETSQKCNAVLGKIDTSASVASRRR